MVLEKKQTYLLDSDMIDQASVWSFPTQLLAWQLLTQLFCMCVYNSVICLHLYAMSILWHCWGQWFIFRLNNRGPNSGPCETPIVNFMLLDSASQTLIHCLLFDNYEDIHGSAVVKKLHLESIAIKTGWFNCNPKNTPTTPPLLSLDFNLLF